MSRSDEGIEASGLVRQFKDVEAVAGIDLRSARGDLRLPRPERRRQVDDRPHADDPAPADGRPGECRRFRRREARAAGARVDRRGTPGGGARPVPDRARAPPPAGSLHGIGGDERKRRIALLLDRVGLASAGNRKVRTYSGGMKRRLDLALALIHDPVDPLPRRADDRPRPAEPHRALGRGRTPRSRRGRHRVPDHAVPRGSGRARRPGRDHRPRPDRRRGHARATEGADRQADGRGRARVAGRARAAARPAPALRAPRRRRAPARSPCSSTVTARCPRSCARSTRRTCARPQINLHEPSLDDVFLAKTGRTLEGAEDEA